MIFTICVITSLILVFLTFLYIYRRPARYNPDKPMISVRGPDGDNHWHWRINMPEYRDNCCRRAEFECYGSISKDHAISDAKIRLDKHNKIVQYKHSDWIDASDEYRQIRIFELERELGLMKRPSEWQPHEWISNDYS